MENGDHYNRAAANIAHERTMTALKSALDPHYDLAALWDMHVLHEFETRDVDATMATMVAEPYVNHIPTMTGGYGHSHKHGRASGRESVCKYVLVSVVAVILQKNKNK